MASRSPDSRAMFWKRDRAIFWQRSICKLDGYEEAARLRKRQRTGQMSNVRFGERNIMKMADLYTCNPRGNPPKKLEDETNTSGLEIKEHLCTSMLDTQRDSWSAQITRQLIIVEKYRGMLKGGDDIYIEETFSRLPAEGGGWDKNRKRKQSGNRLITMEKNVKQAVCVKLSAPTMSQPPQAQCCRSRASSRMVEIQNSVKSHIPIHSGSSTESKIEIEVATHLRDYSTVTEEKIVPEGKNKTDINVNRAVNHSTVAENISGPPETCSIPVLDCSSDFCNSSGADAGREQGVNKIKSASLSAENSEISSMSTSISASKMSHLIVRRPLTILRTSKADFGPPASHNDTFQILSQGLSSSGVGAGPSRGVGVLPQIRRLEIHSPEGKVEPSSFISTPTLSDGEKSGGKGNKLDVKVNDTGVAFDSATVKAAVSLYPARNRNVLVKGRTADNVEARGQMSSANLMVTPVTKKVENTSAKIPLQSVWCGSDGYRRLPKTSVSKSGGPPLKKQMIRKSSIHSGKVVNSGFQTFAENFPGELDDDREELLIAADFARNARYRACSSSLWKIMECYFTSVTSQDESYLKHQLDFADALGGSLYQSPGDENDDLDGLKLQHPSYSGGRQKSYADQESIGTAALSACSDITRTLGEAPSLYQRVLSALIEDIESKETSLHCEGRNGFQCASDDSHCGSCNYNGFEAENRDRMAVNDINCEAKRRRMDHEVDPQLRNQGHVPRISQSNLDLSLESIASPTSSFNCNYHMLSVDDKLRVELQSIDHQIGGEDSISKDILELQAGLVQQMQRKNKYIRKIYEAVKHEKDAEKRNMEQAALDKFIEMAYKKQRVSRSSKRVLRRVSNQAALPFAERTLARCREFEDTGKSCFSEPSLQNIIFSPPMCNSFPNSVNKHTSRSSKSKNRSSSKHNMQLKGSGSRDKKQYMEVNRDLLPNGVCSESLRAMSDGSMKGKRSERARDQTDKTKLKPKVKASCSLASEADPGSRYMGPTHAVSDSPRASSPSMAMGSGQDQDWIGLDVPWDDLTDVHFFI